MTSDIEYNFDTEHEKETPTNVVFRPNPGPQTTFLAANELEVLFGGAAGGGKSYALLAAAARNLGHPEYRGLIVRKSLAELTELIDKAKELYPKIFNFPLSKLWKESPKEFRVPGGGVLWFSYLERDSDALRYQGLSFCFIAFDELTHWNTSFCWDYLRSRLRTRAGNGLPLHMRATSNPGGPGHIWVKKLFVDPSPPGKAFYAQDPETGQVMRWPEGHRFAGQPLYKRRFIPAKLSDNPYLYEDGQYEANLLSLPEHKRRQLLDGDWDIIAGAAFPEWNRHIHTVEPYFIPSNWRRFRACDYGYSSKTGVVWFAIDPNGTLIVYRELYVSNVLAVDLADMILDIEADEKISYGVLDSSVWAQRGDSGPSMAEAMIRKGCKWRKADRSKGSREAGKNEFHRRLQVDENTGLPRMVFFNNCVNCIAQIPVLPLDPDNPEDVDTDAEDHLYDAIRYGIMTRPRASGILEFGGKPLHKGWVPADSNFGY